MKFIKKPIAILTTGLLFSGIVFASNVDASQGIKKLDANYRNIKIIYNSKAATIDPKTEPFITNGTTYVPLRMVSELLNKSVLWDAKTNTITINDKTATISPTVVANLNAQITTKDARIAQLEKELNTLKTQQSSEIDLDDLEDQLNEDYGDFRDIDDVEIFLDGDEDDIEVTIEVDDKDWKALTNSKKIDFLQDIVDDILDEFEDADIEGTVEDANGGDELSTFEVDRNDDVELEDETIDLDDLETELLRNHRNNSDIDDIDIYLDGDEEDIDLTIEVNEADWNALSESEQEDFIEAIVEDILDEYEDADIDGTIERSSDNREIDEFTVDSRGYVTIR
ncbi:copper amine oxidase N-terminal domain-containing protein [Calidifontibacillus oryziterrae]|uniref:copper amine oxidase N-terminal domain-containing protein n=1 Tax=Calidifontibacillus oryziterrae TaxID=1191699 RepID=UPI0002F5E05F|nr:copper amine oxidase N-terminal domain-containing protein [Calidifontibacillus oryziterrae]